MRKKSATKKINAVMNTFKARADSDLLLCRAVVAAHNELIQAIARATSAGLRVEAGRDLGTPIQVYRPITQETHDRLSKPAA